MWRVNSLGKNPDAGKDWGQEEKGTTEDEMVGWHHQLTGHEFEQAPGDGEGRGSLVCRSPWGHKESDTTEWLNNNKNKEMFHILELLISLDYLRALFISLVVNLSPKFHVIIHAPNPKAEFPQGNCLKLCTFIFTCKSTLKEALLSEWKKPSSAFCLW